MAFTNEVSLSRFSCICSRVESGYQQSDSDPFYQAELSMARQSIQEWSSLLPQCLSQIIAGQSLETHNNGYYPTA